jgi:hypothetical protein
LTPFTESVVESAALACLEGTGWQVAHVPDITRGLPAAERRDPSDDALADVQMLKLREAWQ